MPVTTLDPRTALLVIDLQKGIAALPAVHPIGKVAARAAELACAFRSRFLPVVLVNVDAVPPGRSEQPRSIRDFPPGWTDIIPEMNAQPGDILVTKKAWGAFTTTALHERLQALGVTQIVLAGVATSAGVESTARHAHELGYNVTFATDAMSDLSLDSHTHSLTRIFPRLGETGTTHDILARLAVSPA